MEYGKRVGAILSATEDEVKLLGWGVYGGDELPGEDAEGVGAIIRLQGRTNPKIILDSGEVVWGYQCWWAPEAYTRKVIGDRKITLVNLKGEEIKDAKDD